jgi:glycosyltransferase involved in cell wall biosynthesis
VGFTGILRPWHGVDLLLEAIARLHTHRLNIRVLVVGDGPSQSALKTWAHDHNLDSVVTFTGRVGYEQIPEYLSAMDIGVSPRSTFYASPMKVPEYMATGLAVVAPRMPNIEDLIVDGRTGLLFTPEDAGELAHSIERLASDRGLVTRIATAARVAINTGRTWSHNAAQVVNLVTQLRTCA